MSDRCSHPTPAMPEASSPSWLSLLRAQGETNLGAGLERLAALAAAAHREQVGETTEPASNTRASLTLVRDRAVETLVSEEAEQ